MCIVERDEIGQRAHVCVRERCQIVRDLRPEFEKQRREFGTSEVQEGSFSIRDAGGGKKSIRIDNRRAETVHHAQSVLRKRHRLFVARDAAPEEGVIIEERLVPADAFSAQGAAPQKWRVISLRRLHNAQQYGDVGDRTRHGPGRVLLMTDRNDPVLRNQTKRRF